MNDTLIIQNAAKLKHMLICGKPLMSMMSNATNGIVSRVGRIADELPGKKCYLLTYIYIYISKINRIYIQLIL